MKDSNENNGLKIAEQVSVGASVVGTLAGIWSQQMIVVAAPLTLALSLNLINRAKFQQKLEDDITVIVVEMDSRIEQVDKEVAGEIKSLQASVQDLSLSPKTDESQSTKEEIYQIQREFVSLSDALNQLATKTTAEKEQQKPEPTPFDPTYLEAQITELKAALTKLQKISNQSDNQRKLEEQEAKIAALTAELKKISALQEVAEVRKITESLQQEIAAIPAKTQKFDDSLLNQDIQQLKESLSALSSEFKNRRELQNIAELRQIVESIKQQITDLRAAEKRSLNAENLEQEIQQLKGDLGALNSQFEGRSELERISELREITDSIQQQVAAIPGQPSTFDPRNLEQEIQQLKGDLAGLTFELRELAQLKEVAEIRQITDSLQERLLTLTPNEKAQELGQELERIKANIQEVNNQFEARTELQEIEEIRQITSSLQQQLDAVTPEFNRSYLEQENQELKAEKPTLKEQIAASSQELTRIPELIASFALLQQQFRELQQQKEQLEQQLQANQKKVDRVSIIRQIQFPTYYNSGDLSLESVETLAELNGISEEFELILKTLKEHGLTLNAWPTNLMVSPPENHNYARSSNCSRCLLVVSGLPSSEGKIKIWLSTKAIANFYPVSQYIRQSLGSDGWSEMDKIEVEKFVATLNQVFASTKSN